MTAGLSVLFYLALARLIGDRALGEVILLQSGVAIVQMLLVPGAWIHVLAAQGEEDLRRRLGQGAALEWLGIAAGLGVVLLGSAAAARLGRGAEVAGAAAMFISLASTGASTCMGWLRARRAWTRYMIWLVLPNLLRVALAATMLLLPGDHPLRAVLADRALLVALFFLLPDLVRVAVIYVPIMIRHFRWQGLASTRAGARLILRSWWWDVGSAITDVADKLLVGALAGPTTLVVYFFARRVGIIATMVIDPFYAEQYRRIAGMAGATAAAWHRCWRSGVMLALLMFGLGVAGLLLALQLPILAQVVPAAIAAALPLFILLMLADGLITANRWSRFYVQIAGGAPRLLTLRLGLFALFAATAWLLGQLQVPLALAVGLGAAWLAEALVLARWTRSR